MSLYDELVKVQLAQYPSPVDGEEAFFLCRTNEDAASLAVTVFVAWLQDHQTLHELEKLGLSESLEQMKRGEGKVLRPKEDQ